MNTQHILDQQLMDRAIGGTAEDVEHLLQLGANPAHQGFEPLRAAAVCKNIATLQALIPYSDVQARDNAALRAAVQYKRMNCVDLLYPLSDAVAVFEILQRNRTPVDQDMMAYLESRIAADRQRAVLGQVVDTVSNTHRKKI